MLELQNVVVDDITAGRRKSQVSIELLKYAGVNGDLADTLTIPSAARLQRAVERVWIECWTSCAKGEIMKSKDEETSKKETLRNGDVQKDELAPSQAKESNGSSAQQLLLLEVQESSRTNKALQKEIAALREAMLQHDDLVVKNKELERTNCDLKDQIAALQESTKKSAEILALMEKLKEERDAAEKRVKALEETIAGLRVKLQTPTQDLVVVPEDVGRAKASFRVDVYLPDDEANYRGRIEHILTKEAKTFTGFDKNAITTFIADRLPKSERATASSQVKKPTTRATGRVAVEPAMMRLSVMPSGSERPTRMVKHNKPFKIDIALDEKVLTVAHGASVQCTASVQARPIEGGSVRSIGQYSGVLSPKRTLTLQAYPLSTGFYYLSAQVTVNPQKAGEQALRFVEEQYAVDVC